MTGGVRLLSGLEYLEMATKLLRRARLEDATAGLWDAADIQWWWRRPRPSDDAGHLFWPDAAGEPEAAVILTDWKRTWACDPIILPSRRDHLLRPVWVAALQRVEALGIGTVEVAVRDDDAALAALLAESGFVATEERGAATWMEAADRPPVSPLAAGFELHDRTQVSDRPHHLIMRNGPNVADRLAESSLYRPELDLCIDDHDGAVAAYGLFWFDPVTHFGLVEPMRTERGHQRRGLAKHLLTAGLDRLARVGATRLEVNYEVGNLAAEGLYLGTGFLPKSSNTVYVGG